MLNGRFLNVSAELLKRAFNSWRSKKTKKSKLKKVKPDLKHNGYLHLFSKNCEIIVEKSKLTETTSEQQKLIDYCPTINEKC